MWARDTGLLQALPPALARLEDTATMGTDGSGKGCVAGQERGGDGVTTGSSTELRPGGAYHPRRRADANSEWERDGAGDRACTKGCYRPGHWTSEAAVEKLVRGEIVW